MKPRLWRSISFLAVLALLVVACGAEPSTSGEVASAVGDLVKNADGYVDISAEQLAAMMDDKDFTLVNVHVPYEGELPQTDLHIPYDQVAKYIDQLPDKDAPIVLYCRSGGMSTSAAEDLVAKGYTKILEVDGGFNAWQAAGHELIDTR